MKIWNFDRGEDRRRGEADVETFGDAVRRLRGTLSLRELARRAYIDSGHLSRIESGHRPPSAKIASALDAALGAAGELVSLAATKIDRMVDERETEDMQRRTLLASIASLGGSQLIERSRLTSVLSELIAQQGDKSAVDDWDETAWEYGYRYLSAPRDELINDLTVELATLRLAVARASTDSQTRRALDSAGGRLAAILAMACTDLGYASEARRAWRLARGHSDASGSREVQLWVRGQEALLGLYSGRPLPTLLAIADQGLALKTESPTAGTAVLLAARAQVAARLGRSDDATATLIDLKRTFEELPEQVSGSADTIYGWPERRLRHVASFVHAHIGLPAPAYRAHEAALATVNATSTDQRCQIEMHRATRLVKDGHAIEGISHAAQSLVSVPANRQGRFVLAMAAGVVTDVPLEQRHHPQVIDYLDQLALAARVQVTGGA